MFKATGKENPRDILPSAVSRENREYPFRSRHTLHTAWWSSLLSGRAPRHIRAREKPPRTKLSSETLDKTHY